jgi:hypothetical protein
MCLSYPTLIENQKNGSVVENRNAISGISALKKKNMYLKKIASEMVVNSGNDGSGNNIKVKDVVALVNRNRKNTPMVARKSLPVPYPKENSRNGATKEVINAPKGISVRPGSEAFYKIFIHSRNCVSCENPKCKKMKKIQAHFMECSRSGQNCPLCKQLIGLLATFVKH